MPGDARIAVIASTQLVDRLDELAREMPVWVIACPESETLARGARESGADVTTFSAQGDPEDVLLSVIDEIDLHHGQASHPEDPMQLVEVIGATPSTEVTAAFKALGFGQIELTARGFLRDGIDERRYHLGRDVGEGDQARSDGDALHSRREADWQVGWPSYRDGARHVQWTPGGPIESLPSPTRE